jgi:DNA-binding NtrC family response regulator
MAKEGINKQHVNESRAGGGAMMKSRLEALVAEMVEKGILFEDAVKEFEKHFILTVLNRTNGNLSKAAEELHVHRNTLSKRVEQYYQNGNMAGARHRRTRSGAQAQVRAAAASRGRR